MQLKLSWYQPPTDIPVSWIDSDDKPLEDQLAESPLACLSAANGYIVTRSFVITIGW
jgi:hypothetical protein